MKFKFIGVPGEKHEELNMFGTVFPLGEAVEITGKGAEKLKSHPHFQSVGEGEKAEAPTVEELAEKALSMGIDVKGTWGVKKLSEEIEKAEAQKAK